MAFETLEGVLSKTALVKDTGKWQTYNIAFNDGVTEQVLLPSDSNVNLSEYVGQNIPLFKKNDAWFVSYKSLIGDGGRNASNAQAPQGGSNNTQAPAKTQRGSKQTADDYWKNKYKYEVDIKDPQIGLRSLFIQTSNVYAACLPFLKEKPTNSMEVDTLIDEAFAKAQEMSAVINRIVRKQGATEDTQEF